MPQMISSGSVKCISVNKKEVIVKLKKVAKEARKKFPEIKEKHPIKRMKPYFNFFSEKLKIGIDLIVAKPDELENLKNILKDSLSLLNR